MQYFVEITAHFMVEINALTILQKTKQIYLMSLLAKGALAFTTVAAVQDIPMTSEASKMIISGVFSLGSVLIVELFKFLKGRRLVKKTNQTNDEQPKQTDYNNNDGRQITVNTDSV